MNPANIVGPGVRHMISQSTGMKIPTIAARGLVFTPWQPSPEEIQALEAGAFLWLVQRGTYIPEMSMMVGMQADVVPRDLQLEALEDVSPDRQRLIENLLEAKSTLINKRERMIQIIFLTLALACGLALGMLVSKLLG